MRHAVLREAALTITYAVLIVLSVAAIVTAYVVAIQGPYETIRFCPVEGEVMQWPCKYVPWSADI